MKYVAEYTEYKEYASQIYTIGLIVMFLGILWIIFTELKSTGRIILIVGAVTAVVGLYSMMHVVPTFVIRAESCTVAELKSEFNIIDYDASKDVWIVTQKCGGIDPRVLEKIK